MTACSGGGGDGADDQLAATDAEAREGAVSEELAPVPDGPVEEATDREVITTGSLTVEVSDAVDAAEDASRIVTTAGGRVDDWSEQAPVEDQPASAYLTVRIPAEVFLDTVEELKGLGDVRDLSLSREDVTLQVTDLEARIDALELSIARLERLMREAESVADLLTAEEALTQRQAELDSLRAQRTYLAEQVDLSTLYLALLPKETAPSPAPGGFWGGVQTGWAALVNAFNQLLVVLGVLLPWVALAGVVLAVVVIVRAALPKRLRPPSPAAPGAFPRPAGSGGPGGPAAPGGPGNPGGPGAPAGQARPSYGPAPAAQGVPGAGQQPAGPPPQGPPPRR